MTEPTVPVTAKPRRTVRHKSKEDDEVTKIEFDIDDIQIDQVRLLERPRLQEYIAKAEKEVEEAHEEGIKLIGNDEWLKVRQGVKNSQPPSRLEDDGIPDTNEKMKPSDGELRNEVRYYVWYRPGIKRALERVRKEKEEEVETETESEDEVELDKKIDEPPKRAHGRMKR